MHQKLRYRLDGDENRGSLPYTVLLTVGQTLLNAHRQGERNEVKLAAYWTAVSSVNNTVALGSPVQAIQEAETLIL
jgi:hypothetical protein